MVWVVIACIIPDLPWVYVKLLVPLHIFDPYDLRLYAMVQASLAFCLLLSLALASFCLHSRRVFTILAINSLGHLLLDSLQIKWGNGVHLLLPLSPQFFQFELTWPEHPLTLLLTLFGWCYLLFHWKSLTLPGSMPGTPRITKIALGLLLSTVFMVGPLPFLNQLEKADAYHLHTLRMIADRPGKEIAFDRVHYFADEKKLRIYTGEYLNVHGPQPHSSGRVSFIGHFATADTIYAERYHLHRDMRDAASMIGLFMACLLLTQSVLVSALHRRKTKQGHQ